MFRDSDFKPFVHKSELLRSQKPIARVGADIPLSEGVLVRAGETTDLTFNTNTLLASLNGKMNGAIPDLGIYLRSGVAQTDFNIPDKVGSKITNALRFAQITGEHTDIAIPLRNLSKEHARHIPERTGIIQLYHWPEEATLKGKALRHAVEQGNIQFSNDAWDYLYSENAGQTDEEIIGIRVKLQGEKQKLGKLQQANIYDNVIVPTGGIADFRKYIAQYREPIEAMPEEAFSWVDHTAPDISLNNIHALIVNPNHSSSRFMKGQVATNGRKETNWQVIGEFYSRGEENHMDFLFADAA